ncbi:MAG: CARDB domain-containing protein, partial [Acidimicrobiales bacterium]|nr:CARDB domain-containing protein [Acidimicrobiales bacterium]
ADLKVSAVTVTPAGNAWSLSYTVANTGLVSAGSSTLAFGGGPGTAPSVAIPSLAPNATRSGTVQFPRADCYVFVTATADAGRVVTEMSETTNARNAVGVLPGCPPRYKVSASHFKAIDESGADWSGSDEAFWLFSGVSTTGTAATRATQVYGSMDTDDTQYFGLVDQCVWGCGQSGAPAPLASTAVGKGLDFMLNWAEDDLLGTNTYAFSAAGLAAALPNQGTSFVDTRIYTDGDAKYSLTMYVSRVV